MSPKVHSLTGRIMPKVMRDAFKKVKHNRGAAGIDKVSIQMFEANLEQNLDALMRDLKTGVFQSRPLRRVFIDKGNGKLRPLGIPAVISYRPPRQASPLTAHSLLDIPSPNTP